VRVVNANQDHLGWSLSTTPQNFAEEMALLAYDHVHVMTMSEFTRDLHAHQQPLCKSVVLTFDDGFASLATDVAPLLYQYGFPATSFVISSFIGAGGYMTAQQILWVQSLGITIGDHTVHHLALAKLSSAQAEAEIVGAQQTLDSLTGQPVVDFCYPMGSYDAQVAAQIQAAGFEAAFAEDNGAQENWNDRFWLSRFEVLGSWSVTSWARTIGIAPPPVGWTPPPPPYPVPPPMGS
jgi:peptidoglycan/xylan/chitin deacetylase (PgdA/CDA1 family)